MNENYKINIAVSSNILENSIDLLLDGIEGVKKRRSKSTFFSPTPQLKSSLLSVTTGVELLLKAKIVSIDWQQLFKDPSKANQTKLFDGSLTSVSLEKCLPRIESISSIRFSRRTKNDIEAIRIIRNKIAHYHHKPKDGEILTLIANAIGIYIEFYKSHILESFCEEEDRTRFIDRDLMGAKDYVKIRVKRIKEAIKDCLQPITYHFSECPECLQDVHILKSKETVICAFCMHESDIKESAQDYSEFNNLVKLCSRCGCESMSALHSTIKEQEAWQCIICGSYINRPQQWGLSKGKRSKDSIKEEHRSANFKWR